jgi:hypothetical protein
MIGLLAGTVGTSISNGLLALRKQLDPTFVTQNEPPSVVGNAACWALHMGISSNLRYQVLGGADGVSGNRIQGLTVHSVAEEKSGTVGCFVVGSCAANCSCLVGVAGMLSYGFFGRCKHIKQHAGVGSTASSTLQHFSRATSQGSHALCLTNCLCAFDLLLQMLVKLMPMGVFRAYSAAIRGANNIVGGISFVTIARMFGVQKSGSATPALAEA